MVRRALVPLVLLGLVSQACARREPDASPTDLDSALRAALKQRNDERDLRVGIVRDQKRAQSVPERFDLVPPLVSPRDARIRDWSHGETQRRSPVAPFACEAALRSALLEANPTAAWSATNMIGALRSEVAHVDTQLKELTTIMPPEHVEAQTRGLLECLASGAGISLSGLVQSQPEPAVVIHRRSDTVEPPGRQPKGTQQVHIMFTLSGERRALDAFFSRLENQPIIYTCDRVGLRPAPADPGRILVDCELRTFLYSPPVSRP